MKSWKMESKGSRDVVATAGDAFKPIASDYR